MANGAAPALEMLPVLCNAPVAGSIVYVESVLSRFATIAKRGAGVGCGAGWGGGCGVGSGGGGGGGAGCGGWEVGAGTGCEIAVCLPLLQPTTSSAKIVKMNNAADTCTHDRLTIFISCFWGEEMRVTQRSRDITAKF